MASVATLPEQGQMVSVRSRNWMVTDVSASTLPPERLQTGLESPQHLLTLSSVEDDGLGEELNVIWELEPGARVVEKVALPDPTGFDPPDRLDAFLDAVRWGASSSADVRNIQAPFRSGIDIEDYQLDPVVRAIQMPRVNLLVADDVGLGKTIEAGMVALELIIRHRTRKILIVCPASLAGAVAGADAGQVRPRLPHRELARDGRASPQPGHPRQPVEPFPPAHHQHRLPQARATAAAVPGTPAGAGRASLPPQVRSADRR